MIMSLTKLPMLDGHERLHFDTSPAMRWSLIIFGVLSLIVPPVLFVAVIRADTKSLVVILFAFLFLGGVMLLGGLILLRAVQDRFFRCTYLIDRDTLTKRYPDGTQVTRAWKDLVFVSHFGTMEFADGKKVTATPQDPQFLQECYRLTNNEVVKKRLEGMFYEGFWDEPKPRERIGWGRRIFWYFYTTPNTSFRRFAFYLILGALSGRNTGFFPLIIIVGFGTIFGLKIVELFVGTVRMIPEVLFLILFLALVISWLLFLGRILVFFPFPECKQGKCRSIKDYEWSIGTIYGWEYLLWHFYQCSCGDLYVRRGRHFMIAVEEGPRPYKKLVGFRRWADDPGPLPKWADFSEDPDEM